MGISTEEYIEGLSNVDCDDKWKRWSHRARSNPDFIWRVELCFWRPDRPNKIRAPCSMPGQVAMFLCSLLVNSLNFSNLNIFIIKLYNWAGEYFFLHPEQFHYQHQFGWIGNHKEMQETCLTLHPHNSSSWCSCTNLHHVLHLSRPRIARVLSV